jgi:predicted aldo/keto reductase-like oxidoreductase
VTHLALAWVAKNPNTSTVILGASKPEQVLDNLKALDVIPKLTPEVLDKIEVILDNKPASIVSSIVGACNVLFTELPRQPAFGRPPLDPYGRA